MVEIEFDPPKELENLGNHSVSWGYAVELEWRNNRDRRPVRASDAAPP